MAGETNTGTSVTVMSDEQVSQLITAITSSITEFKTAVVTELASIKTGIVNIKSQLATNKTAITEAINDSQVDTTELTTALGNIKTQLDTSIATTNTKLENIKSQLSSKLSTIGTSVNTVASKLETDITPENLNLKYGSKTGVQNIAFVKASEHVLNLKRISDSGGDDDGADDEGQEQTPEEAQAAAAVNDGVRENATEIFDELVGYEFGVTEDERITFKTPEAFEESRKGLSFDYTRWYYTNSLDVVDNTEVSEYALLVFDSLVKTSTATNDNGVKRMKTCVDLKLIQTVVITKNTLSDKCIVYFPTQDEYEVLDSETYKTEKDAMDAIVKKYQDVIADQYKGIAFIPVKDIEPGITLEEYRTAAKNIEPVCEYT